MLSRRALSVSRIIGKGNRKILYLPCGLNEYLCLLLLSWPWFLPTWIHRYPVLYFCPSSRICNSKLNKTFLIHNKNLIILVYFYATSNKILISFTLIWCTMETILSSEKCRKSGVYIWYYARAIKYRRNTTNIYLNT
jgi:hypothetical protein